MPALDILPQAAALAGDAMHWWLGELRSMLPARINAAPSRACCDILVCKSATIIDRIKGGIGERLVDDRPLEALDADGWGELAGLIEGGRTRLVLAPPDVYVTRLELPAAARGRLRSAIALQLDHLAPIDPALLSWNSEVIGGEGKKLSLVVAMARTSRIQLLLSLFADHGLPPPKIVAMADGRPVTLFSPPRRMSADRRAWLVAAGLIASIPFTTMAGAAMLSGIEESRSAALQRELAPLQKAERESAQSENLRRALKPLFETPSAIKAIEALAMVLPETAFVREATLASNGLSFTVETGDAEALAAAIAQTPLLASATLVDMIPAEENKVRAQYRASIR